MCKEQIKELLNTNTFKIPEDEFETLFEITRQNEGVKSDKITFKGFLETIRNLKREFLKYRTMFK
jgi:hypothetical protein